MSNSYCQKTGPQFSSQLEGLCFNLGLQWSPKVYFVVDIWETVCILHTGSILFCPALTAPHRGPTSAAN